MKIVVIRDICNFSNLKEAKCRATVSYDKSDGVRVAIQKGSVELWSKKIAKGDVASYNATAQNVIVKKGDRIYFRVQSGAEETSNGAFDEVEWSPVITYQGQKHESLPNGYISGVYKATEGAIYSKEGEVSVEATHVTFSSKLRPLHSILPLFG